LECLNTKLHRVWYCYSNFASLS